MPKIDQQPSTGAQMLTSLIVLRCLSTSATRYLKQTSENDIEGFQACTSDTAQTLQYQSLLSFPCDVSSCYIFSTFPQKSGPQYRP